MNFYRYSLTNCSLMAEIIELAGNASPTEALRVVEQAVMDDEKTKVKDMMDIFGKLKETSSNLKS